MLVKIPNKDSESVITALFRNAYKSPQELYKSLTGIGERKWPDANVLPWPLRSVIISAIPPAMEARIQRKCERAIEAVYAQRHRTVSIFTG
jgi:hypothetical protein